MNTLKLIFIGLVICPVWSSLEPSAGQAQTPAADAGSDAIRYATSAQASVQLLWSDTDQIDGQLLNWRDDVIRLQSALFQSPVHLRAGAVEAIRFANRTEAQTGGSKHQLVLIDGSILVGNVVSSSASEVVLNDYRFGELRIDASKIARLQSNAQVAFAWNGDIRPWQIKTGQWSVDSQQRLTTQQPDSKIWLPLELKESFVVEFEIVSPQTLDFVLATGEDGESSYRLARIGESWIAGTSSDFEIIETLSERQRQLALSLQWNADTRKLKVFQGSQQLVEVADEQALSQRAGILLENLGPSLSVKSLRIVSAAEPAGATLPQGTGSIQEPTARSMDRIIWRDGTGLWCSLEELDDSTLTVRLDLLNQTKKCAVAQIASIVPRAVPATGASSNGEMRLQQGNSRLVGDCEFSFEPLGVQWNSAKLVTPAQLNLRLPLSLVRQQQLASGIDNTERFPDLAQLRSGALIPCRLERADLTHTWLATPFSAEAVRVDNRELCAVEFRPKRTKPGFTKESRDMALSIPRNLEVDLYTHLLIGQNGDLLRGNLVSISERTIEVDSRLEPILVERQFVDTVVYLHPSSESSAPAPTAETQSNPEAQPASDAKPTPDTPSTHECKLSLKLAGGFSIHGSWTGGNTKMIELNTTELGVCHIDVESIQSFHYHAALEPDGEGPGYYAWSTRSTIGPRWKAPPENGESSGRSLVGTVAPKMTLPNLKGETIDLSDHLGKVVVLDFWATWCGPCVASLPKYLEKVQRYADNEVVFLGVNSTETPESVRDFLQGKNWPEFDTLFDYDGEVAKAMLVGGIPHTVVIGRDGKIAHVQVGFSPKCAEELQQVIEKQLH